MSNDKYSRNMDGGAGFGFLANALDRSKGEDGDTNAGFPRSDAEDMSRGARFIPGDVTIARRRGEKVQFHCECNPNCWYWAMPDGSRIYHFDRIVYDGIGVANGRTKTISDFGTSFDGGAGPCPSCGNPNTSGGTIPAEGAAS